MEKAHGGPRVRGEWHVSTAATDRTSDLVPGEWTTISRLWFRAKLITMAIWAPILVGLTAIPYLIWDTPWLLLFPAAVLALFVISLPLEYLEVKHFRYMVREDELLVRKGSLNRTTTAVPYGRIQSTELEEGWIDAKFDLVKVKFVTASDDGTVVIAGLSKNRGELLRDEILADAEARRVAL